MGQERLIFRKDNWIKIWKLAMSHPEEGERCSIMCKHRIGAQGWRNVDSKKCWTDTRPCNAGPCRLNDFLGSFSVGNRKSSQDFKPGNNIIRLTVWLQGEVPLEGGMQYEKLFSRFWRWLNKKWWYVVRNGCIWKVLMD